MKGSFAYIGDPQGDIDIYDLSNPAAPRSVKTYALQTYAVGVAAYGDHLYALDRKNIYLMDSDDAANPRLLVSIPGVADPQGIAGAGNIALIAAGVGGLVVIDFQTSPPGTFTNQTPSAATSVAINGSSALVTCLSGDILTFDISNPHSARLVKTVPGSGQLFGRSAVFGRYQILAIPGAPVQVVVFQDAPHFETQPVTATIGEGEPLRLTTSVSGLSPITFRWFKDGAPVSGQTSTNLVIPAANAGDSGVYWITAVNDYGQEESAHVSVSVLVPPLPISAEVSTLAGTGEAGYLDSNDPYLAKFNSPDGPTINQEGTIFIADPGNHCIRFITAAGLVGTFAGQNQSGYLEGIGTTALFDSPIGLTLDTNGDVLVADYLGNRLRRVLGVGYHATSLIAGSGAAGYLNGIGGKAQLKQPNDLVILSDGIYFTEFNNHVVRKIDFTGAVTNVAGNGVAGFQDGFAREAQFNSPAGITYFNNALFVTDWQNHCIRKITLTSTPGVSTIAGNGTPGFKNGLGTAATFYSPNGICADPAGNLYVTEQWNNSIRRIDTNGWVTTIAGTGEAAFADGDRTTAKFSHPTGIAIHPDGSLIVTDGGNNRIRRIVLAGKTNAWTHNEGFLTVELNPTLRIYGALGETYRIESKPRLSPESWIAVTNITIQQIPQTWTDDRRDPAQMRLYRAIRE